MTETRTFEHRTAAGHTLHGVAHFPAATGRRPAVLLCHGFKGFMDWGFFPYLADLLAARGFVAARFNFSGSGMESGHDRVTDPDAFSNATFSKDVEETREMLAFLAHELAPDRVDADRLGLLGHSRGGGTAIIAARESADEGGPAVRALVTWAAVASFDYLGAGEKDAWRRDGTFTIVNARTGQKLGIGVEVLDDLEKNSAALDPLAAARGINAPWLVIHGSADETVPAASAAALADAAAGPALLSEILDGGHTFGASHPFRGPTPHLIQAMNETQSWFRRYLT